MTRSWIGTIRQVMASSDLRREEPGMVACARDARNQRTPPGAVVSDDDAISGVASEHVVSCQFDTPACCCHWAPYEQIEQVKEAVSLGYRRTSSLGLTTRPNWLTEAQLLGGPVQLALEDIDLWCREHRAMSGRRYRFG